MNGYSYNKDRPTEKCPYCNTICEADFVDIGVGFQQCGPYHCDFCESSEIGPYDEPKELNDLEKQTGWYQFGYGSSANIIHGKHVSHEQMKKTYQEEFIGNPFWHNKNYVNDWWEKIRI